MKKLILVLFPALIIACTADKLSDYLKTDGNSQEDVLTYEGIDSVLSLLHKIPYSNLDSQYLSYSHPEDKFEKELKNRTYYSVRGDQLHYKVVGHFRIKDFLAKDDYYKAYKKCPAPDFTQHWLIDKKVLYMMLDLLLELNDKGYNSKGFHIRTAHRHPTKNAELNGASYSQHMFGKAIDIGVDDIDNNGLENQADKKIVYDFLEQIVGSKGGLGLYPKSMNLHFDCRGFKARWDYP